MDVYHTDVHAFDLVRDDGMSREAIEKFERQFARAMRRCTDDTVVE